MKTTLAQRPQSGSPSDREAELSALVADWRNKVARLSGDTVVFRIASKRQPEPPQTLLPGFEGNYTVLLGLVVCTVSPVRTSAESLNGYSRSWEGKGDRYEWHCRIRKLRRHG